MKKIIISIVLSLMIISQFVSQALATPPKYRAGHEPVEMMADGVLARPLGLISTVIGSTFFVITLPFTIPSNSVDAAKQQLIDYPAWFTFKRPLGEFATRYEAPQPSPIKKIVPQQEKDMETNKRNSVEMQQSHKVK